MAGKVIAPPPPGLVRANLKPPRALTVVAEVRSDSSLPSDPSDAPDYMAIPDGKRFCALVVYEVQLSWTEAQALQLWLSAAPAGGIAATREQALKELVERLAGSDTLPFATYLGTFLASGVAHAKYTMIVGIYRPITRTTYDQAWREELNTLAHAPWYPELVDFLKLILNEPSSQLHFNMLAANVGDLTQADPQVSGQPRYPIIRRFLP